MMRIGLFCRQGWRGELGGATPGHRWATIADDAAFAERVGVHALWVFDHLLPAPSVRTGAGGDEVVVAEAWSLMAALAAVTESVTLGQLATGSHLRSPAVLAHQAATVAGVADGRLLIGLGAGWDEEECAVHGIELGSARARLDRLEATIAALDRHWPTSTGGPERPRLLIAGGGERRTLRIAARHADATNFGGGLDLKEFRAKAAVLDRHCADIGRDPAAVARTASFDVVIASTAAAAARRADRAVDGGWVPDGSPLIGDPPAVGDALAEFAGAGVTEVMLWVPDVEWRDAVENLSVVIAEQGWSA